MRTQNDQKCKWVTRTVRLYKAIDVDKVHQRHTMEILHAGYIGRDENIE